MDSGTRRNGPSEADLDVSAKLTGRGLERRDEPGTPAGCQVVREHDLLRLGAGQGIRVEVPRKGLASALGGMARLSRVSPTHPASLASRCRRS